MTVERLFGTDAKITIKGYHRHIPENISPGLASAYLKGIRYQLRRVSANRYLVVVEEDKNKGYIT